MQKTLRLFTRYLGAGFIATLVHVAVFAGLLPYFGPTTATFSAGLTGAMVAYGLSRHWVFAQRECSRWRFWMMAAGQVLSNTLTVALLTQLGVPAYLAQVVAMAVVTIQGFTINHFWVFKHDTKRKPFQ